MDLGWKRPTRLASKPHHAHTHRGEQGNQEQPKQAQRLATRSAGRGTGEGPGLGNAGSSGSRGLKLGLRASDCRVFVCMRAWAVNANEDRK